MKKFKIVPSGMSGYSVYKRYCFFFWEFVEGNCSMIQAQAYVDHGTKPTVYF